MATSGVTAWPLTARHIITTALEEIGLVDIEDGMTAAEANKAMLRLNGMLHSFKGCWQEATGTIAVTTASTALPAAVGTVQAVRVVDGTRETAMAEFSRDDYRTIIEKGSGVPRAYYVDRQRDNLNLYVWPTPSGSTTLAYDYRRKPDIVTDLSQTVDVPEEYQPALYANLALQLATLFGVQPLPELAMRAAVLKREMEDAERPEAYVMGYGAWL